MLRKILPYAIVCLLVSAGSATAASKITGGQIKDNTITTRDIKNRTLKTGDLSSAAKRSLRGNTGPAGPAGPAGPVNVGGIVRVDSGTVSIAAGDVSHATAQCPAGYAVLSGGFTFIAADGETFYEDDLGGRTSWNVGGDNFDSSLPAELNAYAFCAPSGKAVIASVGKSKVQSRANALDARQRASH